jgi:hypothetical protein
MERRRLAGIGIAVRFHHRKQRGLWSAAACRRFESGSKLPHSKVASLHIKSFTKNKKFGDSSTKRYEIFAATTAFFAVGF